MPPALVANKFIVYVAAIAIEPDITPVALFIVKPAGSLVAENSVGEFVAVIVYEKAVSVSIVRVVALVITGGGMHAQLQLFDVTGRKFAIAKPDLASHQNINRSFSVSRGIGADC